MPGVERKSVDLLVEEAKEVESLGIPVIALFPVIPSKKNRLRAKKPRISGLTQTAVRSVKEACPGLGVMTDVALDAYTSHGQDGYFGC